MILVRVMFADFCCTMLEKALSGEKVVDASVVVFYVSEKKAIWGEERMPIYILIFYAHAG